MARATSKTVIFRPSWITCRCSKMRGDSLSASSIARPTAVAFPALTARNQRNAIIEAHVGADSKRSGVGTHFRSVQIWLRVQ